MVTMQLMRNYSVLYIMKNQLFWQPTLRRTGVEVGNSVD